MNLLQSYYLTYYKDLFIGFKTLLHPCYMTNLFITIIELQMLLVQ